MNEIPENIAQTIIDQAAKEAESRITSEEAHDGTDVAILLARSGVIAEPIQAKLDTFAAIPRSRAGKLRALDLESFAALVRRDYDHGSIVFVDVSGDGAIFEAVLDYHRPILRTDAQAAKGGRDGQRHGREVIVYEPALSDEWIAWTGQAGTAMTQGAFAEWIDDHLVDFADPTELVSSGMAASAAVKFGERFGFGADVKFGYADPEAMIKVSRGLSIRSSEAVTNHVRLETGEVEIGYTETHEGADGKPLKVPTRFLLSIQVFEREAAYLVPVKLAYRKKGPNLEWTFDLVKADRFRDDAIEDLRAALAGKLTAGPDSEPIPIHLAKRA